jgi:hypothetical protein
MLNDVKDQMAVLMLWSALLFIALVLAGVM